MVTVELRLLGPPSLTTAGRPARLHSAKALALLAYLTLEADTPHSRAKLAGLLWGESPDAQARHSLRQILYSLRRALGNLIKDCLVLEEETVVFEPHPDFGVDGSVALVNGDHLCINLHSVQALSSSRTQ